jgi:hypothetical protein
MQKIYFAILLLIAVNAKAQTNPAAFNLSGSNYSFNNWAPGSPAGTYPPNMAFHFINDPSGGSFSSLANGNADYNCAYNLGSRNRFNGQNANGIGIIATSSAQYNNCASGTASSTRFAGAVVLALNSTGKTGISVSWTGRTISAGDGAPTPRTFALKLQYRLGASGNYTDVPAAPEYNSAAAGNSGIRTANLPAACDNRADLFLRWIYYQTAANDGGSRPELALDDISVGTAVAPNNLGFDYSSATISALQPPFVSGTINDALDPAATDGIVVNVTDNAAAIPSTDYTITVASSNTSVVPVANINITKNNGSALIRIAPAAVGYADLTFTLSKGSFTKTLVTSYAASQSASANSRWLTGIADASAAISIDDDHMIVANDESNLLYVYNRNASGLPVTTFDFNAGNTLGLTDGSVGNYKEVDVEAGVRSIANNNKIYWLGSMSNSTNFNDKPNRNRLFATTTAGTGTSTTFANAGHYSNLRQRLITWGDANGYDFTSAAAAGQDPKLINGFNVEGMVFAPNNTTLYIGFRAPLVPLAGRVNAVIAPIQDFETWFNNGAPVGNPVIGSPIELNLGGKGIRDMIRLSTGSYIIIAGNYDNTPVTGMIYKWTGNAGDAPQAIPSFNIAALNAEAVLEMREGGLASFNKLQVISDNGTADYYGDGIEAKDLTQNNYKKFGSEIFVSPFGGVLPIRFVYAQGVQQQGNAILRWSMQQPVDIKSYQLEASTDGISFSTFATTGAGSNVDYTYSFAFSKGMPAYYRIKAIPASGNALYSGIIYLPSMETSTVNVYPNPATTNGFTITTSVTGLKQTALFDARGSLVKRVDFSGLQRTIETNGLKPGNYILKIINPDQSVNTFSIIIQ